MQIKDPQRNFASSAELNWDDWIGMTLLSRGSSGLEGSPAEGFCPWTVGLTTLFQQIDASTLPACVGAEFPKKSSIFSLVD
jgi:hypothetical protein